MEATTSDYFSDESGIAKARFTKILINAAPRNSIHHTNNNYDYPKSQTTIKEMNFGASSNIIEKSFEDDVYDKDSIAFTSTPFAGQKSRIRSCNNHLHDENYSVDAGHTSSTFPYYDYKERLNPDQQHNFKEITQNNFNAKREYNNIQGIADTNNLSDNIAYLEYKNAGEYWRNTPKTDYTYSKLSCYRRELAPGVIAMPNMSRHGLEDIKFPNESKERLRQYAAGDRIDGSLSRIGQYIWPRKNQYHFLLSRNSTSTPYASFSNASGVRQNGRQDSLLWSRIVRVTGFLFNKIKNPLSRPDTDIGRYVMYSANTTKYRSEELHKNNEGMCNVL